MQSANAIEIVDMETLVPTPASSDYLFGRDDLVQQLIKLALHQFVCGRNEPAAVQLASAAYIAGIPRDRTGQKWPPTFDEFWRSFKELGNAELAKLTPRAGVSA